MRPLVPLALALALVLPLAGCSDRAKEETPPSPTPSPSPPPPPPPPSVGSIVASVGDTWRYRGGSADAPESIVLNVTRVDNATIRMRSVTTFEDNGTHVVETSIRADTLALVSSLDDSLGVELGFSPPLPIVIPAEDHEYVGNVTVPTPFGVLSQPARATIRFLGLEYVTVPAGTFVTYRYNVTLDSSGIKELHQDVELWFSPVAEQAVRTVTDGRLQELVGYELG